MFKNFAIACFAGVSQAIELLGRSALLQSINAQDSAGQSYTCTSTNDMLRDELQDFDAILAAGEPFTDMEFRHNENAIYWASMGEVRPKSDEVTWMRASDAAQSSLYTGQHLFGSSGATPNDVRQGSLGNCWFLSAASAIAEVPGRLEKVFINQDADLNPADIYAVNFYNLGVKTSVVVDDWLPMKEYGNGEFGTFFAKVGKNDSLWTSILEKSFAKYYGNYGHIIGGSTLLAIQTMTGAPYAQYDFPLDSDQLFNLMTTHDANNDIMNSGTQNQDQLDAMSTDTGLVGPHAYTVLGPVELSNGQRLVKLRNPWGYEKYSGPWSDTDDTNWTDALRAEVAQDRTLDDGIFFMPLDLYMEAFRSLDVNLNNEDWHYDYFLSVDEPVTGNATSGYCGSQCTEVELYVYSPNAAQDVYLTLHPTQARALPPSCQDAARGIPTMKIGSSTVYGIVDYPLQRKVSFAAGEYKMITIEVDLASSTLPKDWSLVAWAPDEVYVYPKDDALVSDSFEVIGGDGREGFVRPELPIPTFDNSAFVEWATTASGWRNVEGSWVSFNNKMSHKLLAVTMQFWTNDWNNKQDTFLSQGDFDSDVSCSDGGGITTCSIDLLPSNQVAIAMDSTWGGSMGFSYHAASM